MPLQAESAEYLKEIDSLALEFDKQQEAIKALVVDMRKHEETDSELVTERIRASQAAAQHRIDQQAAAAAAGAAEKRAAQHAQHAAQLQADLKVCLHFAAACRLRKVMCGMRSLSTYACKHSWSDAFEKEAPTPGVGESRGGGSRAEARDRPCGAAGGGAHRGARGTRGAAPETDGAGHRGGGRGRAPARRRARG